MRVPASTVQLLLLLTVAPITILCQSPPNPIAGQRGSIEGHVTLEGKLMPGVTITLASKNAQRRDPIARSVTDDEGRFRIEGVAEGTFLVSAWAPALVSSGNSSSGLQRGNEVIVGEGDAVTGVEISLVRGGVVTGRIVDSNKQPLINMSVNLTRVDQSGHALPNVIRVADEYMYKTDDRGVYRIYGLPAGLYRVSVGTPFNAGAIRYKGGYYPRTFYPDVADESKAQVIELDEGREAGNIDITVANFAKSYNVSGQIVDAASGKGMSGLRYGYGAVSDSGQYVGTVAMVSTPSTSRGKFLIDGLPPGRYAAFVINESDSELYSDPSVFDVTSGDVDGVQVSMKRGASISGTIAFEGGNTSAAPASFANLVIQIIIAPSVLEAFRRDPIRIASDGRFSGVGLRPGKATISVLGSIAGQRVTLSRIEHDGLEQQAFDLRAGESVTGVRLVLSY
jgi:hypothetical protein